MRIVQGVADQTVLDSEPIAELGSRESGVTNFARECWLEGAHCSLESAFIETVGSDDEISGTRWVSHERTRKNDCGKLSTSLERGHNIIVMHRRDLVNELRYGTHVFETLIQGPDIFFICIFKYAKQ